MKLKLYITNMETDQIVKFVGYDHYYDEVMSKTSFWNYMSGCIFDFSIYYRTHALLGASRL